MAEQLNKAPKPTEAVIEPKNLNRYDSLKHLSPEELAHVPPVRSTPALVEMLEADPTLEVDARVLAVHPTTGKVGVRKLDRKGFLEAAKQSEEKTAKLREAVDVFGMTDSLTPDMGLVGDDFVPLLGGPFYKNLYTIDFFRACSASFWAYNHDPIAHAALNIMKDFTLGRGYRIDSENKGALALWRAFEKVNKLEEQMSQFALEIGIYGESCFWWLPNNETRIIQRPGPNDKINKGLIPRIRLLDPTVFWEVITHPEDPTSEIAYVWVSPTQYQTYTSAFGQSQPANKFIFQQIPADQISRYKINVVTGEKRGRGDLFSVLGFLKRLRDSVNYSIIALQKQASWAVDVTIRGSQADIDAYVEDQASRGSVAPAGSEFVHTEAITREFLAPQAGKAGGSDAFEWALSMVCAGLGIPVSYFGTHLSGGQTRASALVATEPVAKRFEMRQQVYERVIRDLWDRLMDWAGLGHVDCEITFPEIIAADKSQKLKDLSLAQAQGWISAERAATIAAKEMGITTFEWDEEKASIAGDKAQAYSAAPAPLTAPANALSSQQKNQIRRNDIESN